MSAGSRIDIKRLAISTVATVAVVAGDIDMSFEASKTRLTADGYTQIAMVDASPFRLWAFSPQGSEVVLNIDKRTGEIAGTTFTYPMDE